MSERGLQKERNKSDRHEIVRDRWAKEDYERKSEREKMSKIRHARRERIVTDAKEMRERWAVKVKKSIGRRVTDSKEREE
jgi:hypothetical protein